LKAPNLALYHFEGCPYCSRVRSAMARLELDLELRDILANPAWKAELVQATGTQMVPCLRIEQPGGGVRWLHESLDIIHFLETEVARARG
jgi:glutaredoxin 2